MGAESSHRDFRALIRGLPSRVGLRSPGNDLVLSRIGTEEGKRTMDPRKAIEIFTAVIRTDETKFTKIPMRIEGYTEAEDLQATQTVVALLQGRYGTEPNMIGPVRMGGSVSKLGNNGLSLFVSPEDMASLGFQRYGRPQLTYKFPLAQLHPEDDVAHLLMGFYDFRGPHEKIYLFNNPNGGQSLEKFKAHFRGKRWANLNMLRVLENPDAEVIMPENLDGFRLRNFRRARPIFTRQPRSIS